MSSFLAFLVACSAPADDTGEPLEPFLDPAVVEALDLSRIQGHVQVLADDAMGGRVPTSSGHAAARLYLEGEMAAAGLEPVGAAFDHPAPRAMERDWFKLDDQGQVVAVPGDYTAHNLVGVLPGDDPDLAGEVVVLMAHYDHLGVTEDGEVYNGAYDDAVGVAALLELARTLNDHEVSLSRTVLFLFTDGEEDGLGGALAWVDDPAVALQDVAVAMSVDPFGRRLVTDYGPLAVLGSERSPGIRAVWEHVEALGTADVVHVNRERLLFFYSDQDALWDHATPVPALWVAAPGQAFYHTIDDDPQTVDYRAVKEHLGLLAQAVAGFAELQERPVDEGPRSDLDLYDAREALQLMDGLLGSAELTEDERAEVQALRREVQRALDDGDTSELGVVYLQLLSLATQQLPGAHPGPIPPPFPG